MNHECCTKKTKCQLYRHYVAYKGKDMADKHCRECDFHRKNLTRITINALRGSNGY